MQPGNFPIQGQLSPQSIAAAANATSTYVDVQNAETWQVTLLAGVLGGGTATFSFVQAQDSTGTGAKALTVSGVTLTAMATNNKTQEVQFTNEVLAAGLDQAGGFGYFAVKCAIAAGTGSLVAAAISGGDMRYSGSSA